ncbi:MAG: DsbA family oxidoreductase [Oceanobacter sp.]
MTHTVRIDFVSDVVCPWCVVGLNSLQAALEQVKSEVNADIHFQPFELAPGMDENGENLTTYLMSKYNISSEQVAQTQAAIIARGKEQGFVFDFNSDSRKWNTLDAHRLLHWAGETSDKQLALKQALFVANFTENRHVSDHAVLVELATQVGLDGVEVAEVLASGRYTEEVRELEARWQQQGVSSVPTMIFNNRYAVSGGQPVEMFVEVIRELIKEQSAI